MVLRRRKKTAGTENRKVKNASKTTYDGVLYDSQVEAYMAQLLTEAGIKFERQKEYVLQDGFRYNGEWVRPMCIIPDFYLTEYNIIIDTKGWQTPDSKLKFKLLKHKLIGEGEPEIVILENKKACKFYVESLMLNTPETKTLCRDLLRHGYKLSIEPKTKLHGFVVELTVSKKNKVVYANNLWCDGCYTTENFLNLADKLSEEFKKQPLFTKIFNKEKQT